MLVRRFLDAGEIETAAGRALVEERYTALRRQIPIIYVLIAVNLFGLQVASGGVLEFGVNVPSAVAICALFRIAQWLRASDDADHAVMLRRMRQTIWLALAICLFVFLWCHVLIQSREGAVSMDVLLFGSMTAIGAAYGLSPLPAAARLPLLVLALPLAAVSSLSTDLHTVGAALSISVVALLLLRLLAVNNSQFQAVVESRSIIARQQELAEGARQEAIHAATTDFLTGLPNRRAFVAALDAAIAGDSKMASFAVGILDLDRFKVVNDTYGHATGDELLRIASKRLVAAAGKKAVVARLGGDEFGILLPDVHGTAQAQRTADAILAAVCRPADVEGRRFLISLCCGVATAKKASGRSPSRLLADADLALYEAKDRSAGRVAVFEGWMEAPRRRRAQIERALQLADLHERVDLVYQPIIDLNTGQVIANEALARWTDDELGEISPAEFVPIAEQLNVIGDLSDHLMVKAFTEAATWPEPVRLSFNFSAIQLCGQDSAAALLDALDRAKLPTRRLQVEVTETALLRDFDRANANLALLREAGATIVLDDFGAGFASIGYLRKLRFDQIKLDGGLLTAAIDNSDGERLLMAVIGLCDALGVATVAEHVESEEQLKLLVSLGCGAGQGFWLQRPMSAAECRRFSQSSGLVIDTGP
ncbi:MAG TPA: EAL domain-containing protein, partial [Sphingomicrobium sp.]|nr:EAL domain-containing protein [Sphingomicrobium sp.]